jgi:fumarylpyruvate hydrolase
MQPGQPGTDHEYVSVVIRSPRCASGNPGTPHQDEASSRQTHRWPSNRYHTRSSMPAESSVPYVIPPANLPSLAVEGESGRFPIRRVFCVARNYADHAREMGMDPEREPPFFFTKPADAVVCGGGPLPYPSRTRNLHHEVELVLALGHGGRDIPAASALGCVYGYAVGLDLTRRDLQTEAREKGRPWDTAKAFDRSAPASAIAKAARIGHPERGRIALAVNGEIRQQGDLSEMIWKVPEILAELSTLFELAPGDLVFTGTPAGVGPLVPGDRAVAEIEGVGRLVVSIAV